MGLDQRATEKLHKLAPFRRSPLQGAFPCSSHEKHSMRKYHRKGRVTTLVSLNETSWRTYSQWKLKEALSIASFR